MPLTGTGRTSGPLLAKDIMVTKLFTVRAEEDVFDAIEVLLKRRVSGAPVVDGHHNLVGMLSEKDCIKALIGAVYDQTPTLRVGSAMTVGLVTVQEHTDLLTVATLFLNKPFRALPVVRGSRLVGIIGRRDLLEAVSRLMKKVPEHEAALLYLSAVVSAPPAPLTDSETPTPK